MRLSAHSKAARCRRRSVFRRFRNGSRTGRSWAGSREFPSMSFLDRALSAHERFAKAASYLQSPFLLAVRVYWGWQFAQTGWGKLQHLEKVTGFFTSLAIPEPAASAVFVSWLEFVGGICLALGFGS